MSNQDVQGQNLNQVASKRRDYFNISSGSLLKDKMKELGKKVRPKVLRPSKLARILLEESSGLRAQFYIPQLTRLLQTQTNHEPPENNSENEQ